MAKKKVKMHLVKCNTMASACIQWVLADCEIKKLSSIQGKYTLHSNILSCIVLQKLELTGAKILKPTSYSVSVL